MCDGGARWYTKDGRSFLIPEMSTDHIFNCLRRMRERPQSYSGVWYQRFLRELERRGAIHRLGLQG
jgi:hypothetical protein